jgi:hypothetical protein
MRFSMMKLIYCLLAVFLIGCDQKAAGGQNCSLEKPPRAAGATGNDGLYYFTFPKTVSADYSGCQIMWNEKGSKIWVLTFENGQVTKSEIKASAVSSETQVCMYQEKKLSDTSPKACPDYESIRRGFNAEGSVDLNVPADRDPRE